VALGAAAQPQGDGMRVPLRCELVPKPRNGSVRGQVLGGDGQGVAAAQVQLEGPSSHALTTDATGQFAVGELPTGTYSVRVDAEGYLLKMSQFEVRPAETAMPSLSLVPKPKEAQVELTTEEVRIRKQVFFKTNSAEISEKSNELLSEIADVLLRNPQVKQVEIQGHTDNKGDSEYNRQLSQQRAESVMQWLTTAGVAADRMSARGYGDTRPLLPNLTDRNRARNRRVQFMIREQQ
jgi:outer membrane protein OmpA-like peptidoglycan-associated protein